MEVGAKTWRVVRRGLHEGEIEIMLQSRKTASPIDIVSSDLLSLAALSG
jgi:hypothetical protein